MKKCGEWFQSTYLYKVRRHYSQSYHADCCFNPRTYIRYDCRFLKFLCVLFGFNPRTYIRYDQHELLNTVHGYEFQSTYLYKVRLLFLFLLLLLSSFNPRTYIRYDQVSVQIYKKLPKFQSTYLYKVRPGIP